MDKRNYGPGISKSKENAQINKKVQPKNTFSEEIVEDPLLKESYNSRLDSWFITINTKELELKNQRDNTLLEGFLTYSGNQKLFRLAEYIAVDEKHQAFFGYLGSLLYKKSGEVMKEIKRMKDSYYRHFLESVDSGNKSELFYEANSIYSVALQETNNWALKKEGKSIDQKVDCPKIEIPFIREGVFRE